MFVVTKQTVGLDLLNMAEDALDFTSSRPSAHSGPLHRILAGNFGGKFQLKILRTIAIIKNFSKSRILILTASNTDENIYRRLQEVRHT